MNLLIALALIAGLFAAAWIAACLIEGMDDEP